MSELSQKEIDKITDGLACLKFLKDIYLELLRLRSALEDIGENITTVEVMKKDE